MTNRSETTPPIVFLTPPHRPNINTTERPPVTTTVFAATTLGNTSFAYHASTSTDPTHLISIAFVEANYEILESLLRYRRMQICKEDLRTELEYFSKDYDEELKMEPRLNEPRKSLHHFVRDHPSQQKRFTKTHLAIHNIKQREGTSVRAFATRCTDDTLQILGLHEDQRISNFVHGLKARNLVEHLYIDLPSTYKSLMENTYTWIEAREVATNEASND
nr:hypothetical protein [Tanacetum cinerariifolium]